MYALFRSAMCVIVAIAPTYPGNVNAATTTQPDNTEPPSISADLSVSTLRLDAITVGPSFSDQTAEITPQPTPSHQVKTAQDAQEGLSISKDDSHILLAQEAGIDSSEFSYVDYIVTRESGWRWNAQEPHTHAYGMCQSLPATKMASAGEDWLTNPVTQLKWCNSYAHSRYGGWKQAYEFWTSHHWW